MMAFSAHFWHDPYPYYDRLRREAPVCRVDTYDCWMVSRYDDVLSVLRNPSLFSSKIMARADSALLGNDPPSHTRIRRIVNPAFSFRRVASLESRIRALVHALLAAVDPGKECDLMRALAIPFPIMVIAELLGLEGERHEEFRRWSQATVLDATGTGSAKDFELKKRMAEFNAFFEALVEQRRNDRGNDIISALLDADPEGLILTDDHLLSFSKLLLIAGAETTSNLIGNALLALFQNNGALRQVTAEPSLIPAVIDEALRYNSPVQFVLRETAREAILRGCRIPAGARVMVLLGSANRDTKQFSEPDRFDVTRAPHGHIAFGAGPHHCIGASLARLEARVVLESLLSRFPTLRLAEEPDRITLVNSVQLRGPARLPVVLA